MKFNQKVEVISSKKVQFKDGSIVYKHFLQLPDGEVVPVYSKSPKPMEIRLYSKNGKLFVKLV